MKIKNNDSKIVLFGPYIGDWKEELLSFRPFVKWIYENLWFDKYYISSHFNRNRLYKFIDKNNFIPIYEKLTRDEEKQKNAVHEDIQIKDYNSILLRKTREQIFNETKYYKKDIVQYGLSYVKSKPSLSINNKIFDVIPFNKDNEKNKIVYIPDKSEKKSTLKIILNHLKENYKDEFVVIGDKKTRFKDDNIIRQRIDYFENVYDLIIDYISNAKLVICPCSHWTVLANQQKSFVFSWGKNISIYKTDSAYGFGNRNIIMELNRNLIEKNIKKSVDFAINQI